MGKGSNTTSTATTSSADPQAAQAYRDLIARASGVASTPYQAYTGNLTAPVNAQQTAGISGINANANFASPFIQNASTQAAASSAPLTAGQIQNYLNPYTQNVVDATNAQMTHDNGVAMAGLQGNQIAQGALGGNATGVARGILAGQQGRTMASTDANLYSQGYGQAVQTAAGQQQLGLAGANAQANYGISGQGAALAGAGQQINAGSLQQQTEQQRLNALYGQYQQAQAYPYQQAQWLAGIDTGVGSNLGQSTTGQTTGPPPNQTAQYLGLGLSAAGMFLNRGGRVHRFSGGGVAEPFMRMAEGGVPSQPWSGGLGWIPQMNIHGGSAPHAGSAPSLPTAPAFDPTKFASGISGLSGKGSGLSNGFGAFFNPEAYGAVGTGVSGAGAWGGSSSQPLPGLSADDYGPGFAEGGGVGGASLDDMVRRGRSILDHDRDDSTRFAARMNAGMPPPDSMDRRSVMDYLRQPVRGYAGGGAPQFDALTNGDPAWEDPDVGPGYPRRPREVPADVMNGDPGWDSPDVGPGVGRANFADRFGTMPPAKQNLPFQDAYFAANGVDPKSFAGAPPDVIPSNSRGIAAKPPVVAAADDDEEELPPNATPTQGGPQGVAGAYKPPYQITAEDYARAARGNDRSSFGLGLISPNAKAGLLTAGLGMLASRSPFLGNAVGEGGLAGLSAYGSAEAHDQKVAEEARKLSLEAKKAANAEYHTAFTSGETARHNRATEANASDKAPSGYQKTKDGTLAYIKGGPHDPDQISAETSARAKKGTEIDEDTVDFIAHRVAQGDARAIVGLGRNPAGVAQIQKRVAEIYKEQGVSHEAGAQAILANLADQAGRMTAERTQAGIGAKLAVYGRNVDNAIGVAEAASAAANRTSFTPVNKAINAWKAGTGDPKIVSLGQALNTLTNEYARAIGSGHGTVHDKEQAETQLNQARSHEQLVAIMKVMRQEIQMTKKSMPEARQEMRELYSRPSSETLRQPPAAGAAAPPGGLVEGRTGTKNGRPVVVKGGKLIYSDTGEAAQ